MMKRVLSIVLALMMCVSMAALAENAVLSVRGVGVVSADADTATITLGVREVAEDMSTAQSAVNDKIAKVVEKLQEIGIQARDIHTWSISIYPNYDYDSMSQPVVGYTAENTLSVTTKDIENVGAYIDAAFEAGANTFSDISFSASDLNAENDQALALAVQNAASKAAVLAEAAGMKLGGIQRIVEDQYSYYSDSASYARANAEEADGAGTQVYASQIQVSASISVEYALEPVE